jgi:FMN phosphatase YigB (HAD superfamily)
MSETLHVGDIYHVDVVGARAAGLTPVLVDEANLYAEADRHRVTSIAELPSFLQQS